MYFEFLASVSNVVVSLEFSISLIVSYVSSKASTVFVISASFSAIVSVNPFGLKLASPVYNTAIWSTMFFLTSSGSSVLHWISIILS